jgi:peroxiredoxin family protein
VRGLTVVLVSEDPARFGAAVQLAAASAALGGRVTLYCHDAAVRCLADADTLAPARDLGVRVIACQTGLAQHGATLPDWAEAGGLVSLIAELGDDRLVTL